MAYLGIGMIFVSWGLGLLASKTGLLLGGSLPFSFGEYKNVAGVFFIAFGVLVFRAGLRSLRNEQ